MIFRRKKNALPGTAAQRLGNESTGLDKPNLGKIGETNKKNLKSLDHIRKELDEIRIRSEFLEEYESLLTRISESHKAIQSHAKELQEKLEAYKSELEAARADSKGALNLIQRIKGIQVVGAVTEGGVRDVADAVFVALKEKEEKIIANSEELGRQRSTASKLVEIDDIKAKFQQGLKKLLDSKLDKDPRITTLLATIIQYSLLELVTSARGRQKARMIVMANNLYRIADQLGRPQDCFNNQEFVVFKTLKELLRKSIPGSETIDRFVRTRKAEGPELEDLKFYFEKIMREIRNVDYGALNLNEFCIECLDENTVLIV